MSYYLIVEDNTPPFVEPPPEVAVEVEEEIVIEQEAEIEPEQETPVVIEEATSLDIIYGEDLPATELVWNWVIVLMLIYVLIFSAVAIVYVRAKDFEDFQIMNKTDEGIEELPQFEQSMDHKKLREQNLVRLSLITWIFHRKVTIEPYSLPSTKGYTKNQDFQVSTWTVYRMFLTHLHPLLSLANHFDLTLKRLDRVIPLVLRTVLTIPICFFSLQGITI
jgi:hypothetical protein